MIKSKSFTAATKKMENSLDWLSDADAPALYTLYALAEELDSGNITPSLVGQYSLAYRALLKRAPRASSESTDPLAQALAEALDS